MQWNFQVLDNRVRSSDQDLDTVKIDPNSEVDVIIPIKEVINNQTSSDDEKSSSRAMKNCYALYCGAHRQSVQCRTVGQTGGRGGVGWSRHVEETLGGNHLI